VLVLRSPSSFFDRLLPNEGAHVFLPDPPSQVFRRPGSPSFVGRPAALSCSSVVAGNTTLDSPSLRLLSKSLLMVQFCAFSPCPAVASRRVLEGPPLFPKDRGQRKMFGLFVSLPSALEMN